MSKKDSLVLKKAKQIAPPVNPLEAVRNSLQMSLFGAISEDDISAITTNILHKAKGGDLKAAKLIFDLVEKAGGGTSSPKQQSVDLLIESPGLSRLRKLVALTMLVNASTVFLAGVCEITGLDEPQTLGLLRHDWFEQVRDGEFRLTPAGKAAVS